MALLISTIPLIAFFVGSPRLFAAGVLANVLGLALSSYTTWRQHPFLLLSIVALVFNGFWVALALAYITLLVLATFWS